MKIRIRDQHPGSATLLKTNNNYKENNVPIRLFSIRNKEADPTFQPGM
jgi:hypothetical protein